MRSLFAVPVFAPSAGAAASAVVIPTAGDASSAVVIPTATKPQPGLYWVLKSNIETEKGAEEVTGGGAFDLYTVKNNNEGIFKILQPSGKEERIDDQEIEIALSRPQDTTFSKDRKWQFIAKQLSFAELTKQELEIITRAYSCYLGHEGNTCGWTTLASAIALLAYKLNYENVKIDKNSLTIEIPDFTGKIELKTGSDNDFENRKALATWLETNQELLVALAPSLNNKGPENFFQEIKRISKLEKITITSDYLTHQILGVADALEGATLEKIEEAKLRIKFDKNIKEIENKSEEERRKFKKELENKYSEQSGMKINWDNITVDDLAILALLSAFLVVMAGPGALALPVAIATFRTLSFEIGWKLDDDGELKKLDKELPSTTPSEPVADQLKQEKTCSTGVA